MKLNTLRGSLRSLVQPCRVDALTPAAYKTLMLMHRSTEPTIASLPIIFSSAEARAGAHFATTELHRVAEQSFDKVDRFFQFFVPSLIFDYSSNISA